jgi:LemA protein
MSQIWTIGGGLVLFAMWMFGVDWRWIAAGGTALVAWTFNTMVNARNQADTAFSTIEVMLKKRYDLIPNLVDTVQRYVEHESQVLEQVTSLRARAVSGQLPPDAAVEVDNQLGRTLRQLFATAEAYPELKANDGFQQLQRSLNEVEEQISAARRAYNASVKLYNDAVHMLPTNLIALGLRWSDRVYFELPEGHGERPDVMARFRSHQA